MLGADPRVRPDHKRPASWLSADYADVRGLNDSDDDVRRRGEAAFEYETAGVNTSLEM